MIRALEVFSLVLVFLGVLPLSNSASWWIRCWDFPRLQLLFLSFLCIFLLAFLGNNSPFFYPLILALLLSSALDVYRIFPYTKFSKIESQLAVTGASSPFKLLVSNVKIDNQEYSKLLNLVMETQPDLLVLIEVNQQWYDAVHSKLSKDYPFYEGCLLENTYGICLFSKFPLKSSEVKFLVDKEIPSIFAEFQLENNQFVELIALHPQPPRPQEGHSTQRDAELMKTAQYIRKKKEMPLLVAGDLNDVAWSHTTRLFKRISGMLDPRIGRGLLSTFPVYFRLARFPLDHVFHTPKIGLIALKIEKDIGSDHFPVLSSWVVLKEELSSQKVEMKKGDQIESKDLVERSEINEK